MKHLTQQQKNFVKEYIKSLNGELSAQKPASAKPAPIPDVMDAKDLQAEVFEEKPIELRLETFTVAI